MVAKRKLRDLVAPSWRNGDVPIRWKIGEEEVVTRGLVFTAGEMRTLFSKAGFRMKERLVVDYEIGKQRKLSFLGNLLYVLQKSSG